MEMPNKFVFVWFCFTTAKKGLQAVSKWGNLQTGGSFCFWFPLKQLQTAYPQNKTPPWPAGLYFCEHTVDGQNPRCTSFQKPWNDDSHVNTKKPMIFRGFKVRQDLVHAKGLFSKFEFLVCVGWDK